MSNCRGCGAKLVWALGEKGNAIPLDPKPPVYEVTPIGDSDELMATRLPQKDVGKRGSVYLVSHFATCPKASRFSRGRSNDEDSEGR